MNLNANISEQIKFVLGLAAAVPNNAAPDYVSLKNFERVAIVIAVKNSTTVTGSAITLLQATSVAGGGEKLLAFAKAYRNIDADAADALSEFAVANNTFTTATADGKNLLYVIEVKAEDLDVNNGFDCIRLGVGNATAATISAIYALAGAKVPTTLSATTD